MGIQTYSYIRKWLYKRTAIQANSYTNIWRCKQWEYEHMDIKSMTLPKYDCTNPAVIIYEHTDIHAMGIL